jgi:hypothetical protein
VVPDCQIRPGDATDHLDWIAQDIVRRKPDVIVCIGDFFDLPSMSSYSPPGGLEKENARITRDIEAGYAALQQLTVPIHKEVKRLADNHRKRWTPRLVFTLGNHEARIDRLPKGDARFEGVVGSHLLPIEECGFERHGFLQPVEIDGIFYTHFWQSAMSPRPIGGSIDNRLNKLCVSFVCGHEQGLRYGSRPLATGKTLHGIVAGSCYLGTEEYRGPQARNEWRGTVVLHDVRDGDFEPMFLSLRYLCQEYAGQDLYDYMTGHYPDRDWTHLR